MTRPRRVRLYGVLLLVSSCCVCAVVAGKDALDDNRYVPGEEWKEAAVTVPAYPRDAELVAVPLDPTDTLKLFVDPKSISRAGDRIMRLTLVAESPSGARNVFFDGIRCETRSYKTYAIGSSERKWVSVADAKWQEIPPLTQNSFRAFIARFYACNDVLSAVTPHEFLQRLR